jgi:sporulation protein YlmC with PRC-barrel domain
LFRRLLANDFASAREELYGRHRVLENFDPKEHVMRKVFITAVALSALAGASALAQNTPSPGANPAPAPTANEPAGRPNPLTNTTNAPGPAVNPPANAPQAVAQNVPAKGPNFIKVNDDDMLSSNVVGLDVYNGQNNNIGKIQDVVFDKAHKVTGYILSVGGFLGMGTHYVAVDPGAVSVTYDQANKTWRASVNATKAELKSAPEFKYGGQWTASRS